MFACIPQTNHSPPLFSLWSQIWYLEILQYFAFKYLYLIFWAISIHILDDSWNYGTNCTVHVYLPHNPHSMTERLDIPFFKIWFQIADILLKFHDECDFSLPLLLLLLSPWLTDAGGLLSYDQGQCNVNVVFIFEERRTPRSRAIGFLSTSSRPRYWTPSLSTDSPLFGGGFFGNGLWLTQSWKSCCTWPSSSLGYLTWPICWSLGS